MPVRQKTTSDATGVTPPNASPNAPQKAGAATPVSTVSPTTFHDVVAGRVGTPTAPSASDSAMIKLIQGAGTRVYANIGGGASTALTNALTAAAQKGLDVRALLDTSAGHDTTWMLQQHLESSGVDTNVLAVNAMLGTLLIADNSALDSKLNVNSDAPTVASLVNKLIGLFPVSAPPANPKLLAPESVKLHPMPESGNTRLIELISAATTSIDLEIYQLQDREVIEALKAAAKKTGMTVRVMLEPKTVGAQNYQAVSAELAAAGVLVKQTPPNFDASHNVDHAKFMIIDGKEMVYGTGNMVRSGLGGDSEGPYNNRDFWIEDTRAQSVKEAQQLFNADWSRQSTANIIFQNLVITPDNADQRILDLINGAQKGQPLYVYNQELEDPAIVSALIAAHGRGADVKVLLGYQPGFGGPPKNDAAIQQLKAAGVDAGYLKNFYLHAKAIVSGSRAYLGSQNFTNGGLKNNRELGQIFDDADLVAGVTKIFLGDEANPGS